MSIKKNNASSNIVYKGLRDDILSLKLIPGSAISETDIASKYNVSRTPVRDAFKALSNEGLLEVKPHVGTFVSLMDINQISDVLYVRKVVELSILKDLANSLTEADELRLKFNLNEQKIFLLNTADFRLILSVILRCALNDRLPYKRYSVISLMFFNWMKLGLVMFPSWVSYCQVIW